MPSVVSRERLEDANSRLFAIQISTAFGLRATYWVGGVVLLAMAIVTFRAVNNRAIAEARVVR